MTTNPRSGQSLVELLVVLALVGLILGVAQPAWLTYRSRASLRSSAAVLVSELRQLRSRAIAEGTHVGWRVRRGDDGTWSATAYRDGDGDGLRTDDVETGIDEAVGRERTILPPESVCRIGFPDGGVPDPSEPSRTLGPEDDPFRFGRSGFVSFSPLGGSTSGSIFLADASGRALCVRLHGGSSRAHLLIWKPESGRWEGDF